VKLVVTKSARESDNTKRIEAILFRPKNAGQEWTIASLKEAAAVAGLNYSEDETKAAIEDLIKRGIVEDTDQPIPVVEIPSPIEPETPVETVIPQE